MEIETAKQIILLYIIVSGWTCALIGIGIGAFHEMKLERLQIENQNKNNQKFDLTDSSTTTKKGYQK